MRNLQLQTRSNYPIVVKLSGHLSGHIFKIAQKLSYTCQSYDFYLFPLDTSTLDHCSLYKWLHTDIHQTPSFVGVLSSAVMRKYIPTKPSNTIL